MYSSGRSRRTLPALDRGLTHGLGLYETLKLSHGVPVFYEEHIARLQHGLGASASSRRSNVPDSPTRSCASRRRPTVADGACRVLVTAGPPDGRPRCWSRPRCVATPRHPLALVSYRTLRAAATLKSNSFVASHMAQRAAQAAGADDAVFVDEDSRMYEASTANVFVWREGVLGTSPTDGSILPGVTAPR